MPFLGGGHWYIIALLIVVLIIFGPGKLPELGGAVGKAIREFRKAGDEIKHEVSRASETESPASVTPVQEAQSAPPVPAAAAQAEQPKS